MSSQSITIRVSAEGSSGYLTADEREELGSRRPS